MRKKQQIKVQIVNPEALEAASINKTKILFELWWKRQTDMEEKEVRDIRVVV